MFGIQINGTGSYLPEKVVTNNDFTSIVDTSDEWIKTRTGMSERRISQGEPTWYMAAEASKKAIKNAGISADEIGIIIDTNVTPDFITPSCACMVQRELGIKQCISFDMNAACTGIVYGIDVARHYLATGEVKYALVIGAENLTKITNYKDRSSCVLFGDGAGACILSGNNDGLFSSYISAEGAGAKHMVARSFPPSNAFMPENPFSIDDGMPESESHYLLMNGKEVYKFAVQALPYAVNQALEKVNLKAEDIDVFIPHQANIRIIETAATRLGISMDKFFVNIDKYGNTSSASLPIALDEAYKTGRIKKGSKVCLVGFGSGLTYGAIIFEEK